MQKTRKLLDIAFGHQQKGDLATASKLYEQLIALHPMDSAFLGMRGMVAFEQQQFLEAEQWLNKAIRISPDDARLHNFLGQVLVELGESHKAESAFGRAVTMDPGFFEAWCNLGISLRESRQLLEAISAFRQALSLSSHDVRIYLTLVEIYYMLGDLEKAREALDTALSLGEASMNSTMWQSLLLRAEGKTEDSIKAEAQAVGVAKSTQELSDWRVKFGSLDVLVGNMAQAEYWLAEAIKSNPGDPAPYIELANARKFREPDRALVEKMESLSAMQGLLTRDLEFSLGKAYTDLGDYRRSFEHYQKANNIALETNHFDAAALVDEISGLIESFSAENMAALPRGSDSNVPIVIIGTPRSGTTLTEQIVSSHSKVEGAGELMFWGRLGKPIMLDMQNRYNGQVADTLAQGYLGILRHYSKGAVRVTDKMPGNFNYLGLIHAVFPKAKIIHCRRHPIDACLSMYFQDFDGNHPFIFALESLRTFYEQYLRLMEHWRKVLPPGTMYELQYENLVEDTEGETRKLMAFLDLDWEEGQMDFFKKERPVFTNSMWQVRQPIYKTSKERWRRYEEFIGPLLPLLKYAPNC